MWQRELVQSHNSSQAPIVRTTLLSLVQKLTIEGYDERSVADRVVDLLEEHRVVLIGTLRADGIKREDLHDEREQDPHHSM